VLAPFGRAARRALRSLAVRWIVVAAAAAGAAAQAAAVAADAEAARAAWGDTLEVVVAVRDLPAGRRLATGDVRVEARPVAVIPAEAVRAIPAGATLRALVVAGEVLVDSRVAPAGLSGVAALVPEGWRAVAVPTSGAGFGSPAPPLHVGDRVDLVAPDVVAAGALVVAVGDDAVTVAVPARDAPAVAEIVATMLVTIALRGA
jgi:pilus assembly protein CpaB